MLKNVIMTSVFAETEKLFYTLLRHSISGSFDCSEAPLRALVILIAHYIHINY